LARRPNLIANLGEWRNEPYMQEPVIAALKRADFPMTLREIADAAAVPLRPANRVLCRLHKKGLVDRRKLAMQRHAFCRKTWKIVPYAARRMLYVYSWIDVS
jgi:predicted transcriptional regulator